MARFVVQVMQRQRMSEAERQILGGQAIPARDTLALLPAAPATLALSLACPLSGSRLDVPVRTHACAHAGCFDLRAFLAYNAVVAQWRCPVCNAAASPERLALDRWVAALLLRRNVQNSLSVRVCRDSSLGSGNGDCSDTIGDSIGTIGDTAEDATVLPLTPVTPIDTPSPAQTSDSAIPKRKKKESLAMSLRKSLRIDTSLANPTSNSNPTNVSLPSIGDSLSALPTPAPSHILTPRTEALLAREFAHHAGKK